MLPVSMLIYFGAVGESYADMPYPCKLLGLTEQFEASLKKHSVIE